MKVDGKEKRPSLIEYLDAGKGGFYLDLTEPTMQSSESDPGTIDMGPYTKAIQARITTDGRDTVEDVILVIQRDRYETPPSLKHVTNVDVSDAWQQALDYHQRAGHSKAPMLLAGQVTPKGALQAFQSLFVCRETRQWFEPVCPQCGMALRLCTDDGLLGKRGLPTYTGSLYRFLYCGSCANLSGATPFYTYFKADGMPDIVRDPTDLIAQWKQLLDTLPDDADLPCRGCPSIDGCYGSETMAGRRIHPVAFYPFFMLVFPAPSCDAKGFLRQIAGGPSTGRDTADDPSTAATARHFLFQDQERHFLEVLYLKLSFLQQLAHQLIPGDRLTDTHEIALSVDSIGVDLHSVGVGLPAYWSFSVRILDAVGSCRSSPFYPLTPESPRLHFLGAVWFHTLLVNTNQQADAVLAEVGRLVDGLPRENGPEALPASLSDSEGVFAANQIMWVPPQGTLFERWRAIWQQALKLGFQLVHTGLKVNATWDGGHFLDSLETLRSQIHTEMFSTSVVVSQPGPAADPSDQLREVLSGILEKWQAAAKMETEPPLPEYANSGGDQAFRPLQPPGTSGRAQDIQETVIVNGAQQPPSVEAVSAADGKAPAHDAQWDGDMEKTIIQSGGAATPPSQAPPSGGDLDRTVVISPHSPSSDIAPSDQEADLAATTIQRPPGQPLPNAPAMDGDAEATVILKGAKAPVGQLNAPPGDDDLEATVVQRPDSQRSTSAHLPRAPVEDDLEATRIINPADNRQPTGADSPEPADDDLEATLIQSPRKTSGPNGQPSPVHKGPPSPPVSPQVQDRSHPDQPSTDGNNDDEDIMEQTIIIRSDVKKE